MDEHNIGEFWLSIQVRLDLEKAQIYYRNQLGCEIDDWGHATRGQMTILLQQASSPTDVRPNGGWNFNNAHLSELDGYNIVLGAMRKSKYD